jgi:hypothetical protein
MRRGRQGGEASRGVRGAMSAARRSGAETGRPRQPRRPEAPARREPPAALALAERAVPAANPQIEITPSVPEYEQLCRDLAKLRKLGAPSNTAAVLAAVHAAAGAKMGHGKRKTKTAGRR